MNFNWYHLEHEWRKHLLSDAKGAILEIAVRMGENFKHYPLHTVMTATDTGAKVIRKAKEAETRGINAVFHH